MVCQRNSQGRAKITCFYGLLIVIVVLLAWGSLSNNYHISINNVFQSINQKLEIGKADATTPGHRLQLKGVSNLKEIKKRDPGDKCTKRLPQAIIAGIQKCGTTTLLVFLNDHPQIAGCLSPVETKFFSGSKYLNGLDWYKNLMPCSYSNQITMEKSPPYFFRRFCAERIREMNPKTKIILTVKEPIERAISMYAMLKDLNQVGNLSFEDYVTSNKRTKLKTNESMIQFSNYQKHMQYWLDNFDMKQILLVDGKKFIDDPSSELMKVERFLNIGSYFTPEKFVFNSTKGKHCLIDNTGVQQCMQSGKGRAHPTVQPAVIRLLKKYFKPLNEKFFGMIGQRFEWGY